MAERDIVTIDREKCTGCGRCVTGCHEGALQIIDGRAVLVSELVCDGLGACIGECPVGAITIERRKAEPYSEVAALRGLLEKGANTLRALPEYARIPAPWIFLSAPRETLILCKQPLRTAYSTFIRFALLRNSLTSSDSDEKSHSIALNMEKADFEEINGTQTRAHGESTAQISAHSAESMLRDMSIKTHMQLCFGVKSEMKRGRRQRKNVEAEAGTAASAVTARQTQVAPKKPRRRDVKGKVPADDDDDEDEDDEDEDEDERTRPRPRLKKGTLDSAPEALKQKIKSAFCVLTSNVHAIQEMFRCDFYRILVCAESRPEKSTINFNFYWHSDLSAITDDDMHVPASINRHAVAKLRLISATATHMLLASDIIDGTFVCAIDSLDIGVMQFIIAFDNTFVHKGNEGINDSNDDDAVCFNDDEDGANTSASAHKRKRKKKKHDDDDDVDSDHDYANHEEKESRDAQEALTLYSKQLAAFRETGELPPPKSRQSVFALPMYEALKPEFCSWLHRATHRCWVLRAELLLASRLYMLEQCSKIASAARQNTALPRFRPINREFLQELLQLLADRRPPTVPEDWVPDDPKIELRSGSVRASRTDTTQDAKCAYARFYPILLRSCATLDNPSPAPGDLRPIDISRLHQTWRSYEIPKIIDNLAVTIRRSWRKTCDRFIALFTEDPQKHPARSTARRDALVARRQALDELSRPYGRVHPCVHSVLGPDAHVLGQLRLAIEQADPMHDDRVQDLFPALVFMNAHLPEDKAMQIFPLQRGYVCGFLTFDASAVLDVIAPFNVPNVEQLPPSLQTLSSAEKRAICTRGIGISKKEIFGHVLVRTGIRNRLFPTDPDRGEVHREFTGVFRCDGITVEFVLKKTPRSSSLDAPLQGMYVNRISLAAARVDILRGRSIRGCDPGVNNQLLFAWRLPRTLAAQVLTKRQRASGHSFFRYSYAQRQRTLHAKKFRKAYARLASMPANTLVGAGGRVLDERTINDWNAYLSLVPSLKTVDRKEFELFAERKLLCIRATFEHYNTLHFAVYRRLRFQYRINRMRADDILIKLLKRKIGDPRSCVVAIGNWSMGSYHIRGHAPTRKGVGYRRLLQRAGYLVLLVNERKTSLMCTRCRIAGAVTYNPVRRFSDAVWKTADYDRSAQQHRARPAAVPFGFPLAQSPSAASLHANAALLHPPRPLLPVRHGKVPKAEREQAVVHDLLQCLFWRCRRHISRDFNASQNILAIAEAALLHGLSRPLYLC